MKPFHLLFNAQKSRKAKQEEDRARRSRQAEHLSRIAAHQDKDFTGSSKWANTAAVHYQAVSAHKKLAKECKDCGDEQGHIRHTARLQSHERRLKELHSESRKDKKDAAAK